MLSENLEVGPIDVSKEKPVNSDVDSVAPKVEIDVDESDWKLEAQPVIIIDPLPRDYTKVNNNSWRLPKFIDPITKRRRQNLNTPPRPNSFPKLSSPPKLNTPIQKVSFENKK